MKSTSTGIDFANELRYTETINAYTYRNFYNGAGVATGDINNDGLIDLYFAGNQVDNKIYLNQGNFKFEDITLSSGLSCSGVWTTGVSMADINGDGWLDIYVCKSGPQGGKNRYNELFINNGDLTFTEKAKEYGLNDEGLSTHAAFFDYDKDGDLDIYLLNNSGRSVGLYDLREGQREIRDSLGSNKLYRNDGDYFSDVSELAGIYGSSIGYGLGVTIADLNRDGWQDIYVSNDFFERDYLYFNNGDGTFTESLEEVINEISIGSMGADIADLTNDGFPEIYVTEMLPDRWDRVKTKALFENWDKYQANVSNGYYHQFSRNVLQLNNGFIPNDTNESVHFSEIARFTNLYATDWSWGALIFDYNNDGNKDIFVANGVGKDLTDQDYINYYANNNVELTKARRDSTLLTNLMDKIPSEALPNYLFHNYGDLRFENKAKDLGLDQKTFSNGAAYADLDNDGDMDLVVNNIDAPASVYRNNTSELENTNYIQIALSGKGRNSAAFGTQIEVYAGGQYYFSEQTPVKGYMSSVDPRIHFGLDQSAVVDSIVVTWPDATTSRLYNVNSNQIIELDQREVDVQQKNREPSESSTWFTEQSKIFKTYTHTENSFVDFNRDQLLFEMFSNEGPVSATADV
ncbi:MAG: CRTAC1 family protein, partial [Bacteroidota bacterium]